jgi:hypothetical protein
MYNFHFVNSVSFYTISDPNAVAEWSGLSVTSQNKSGGAKSGQRNGQWNPKCRELNPSMLYQLH